MRLWPRLDEAATAKSRRGSVFATGVRACATDESKNAARRNRAAFLFKKREAYFFFPAGFLAFALPADFATFAAFFFAAIVSTSPDIGMPTASASIRENVNARA
jgi:hypothetical protein